MTETALSQELTQRCGSLTANRHLLVIQDTTSFNLNNHYYRIRKGNGVGPIEDNFSLGFFLHASLVIDLFSDTMLGFSDVQLWNREQSNPHRKKERFNLPIEEKESYKWIKACEQTKHNCAAAESITFVEDRDGDIYEQFARITDDRTHFVIRASKDRKLSNGHKLYDTLEQRTAAGKYELEISADKRKKRIARKACIKVSFGKVCINKSTRSKHSEIADNIELYAVQAIEENYNGKDKVCWRLLTTHTVQHFDDAINIIELYRKRWYIEQLFRLLKKKGFEMEESEMETGWALRKLSVMALNATLRIMQLMHATEDEKAQPISEVFSKDEQQCLAQANKQLDKHGQKQGNPYTPNSLVWAKWIIARLGGWKGYASQRQPGPITLKRGLDVFNQMYRGWSMALKHYYEDVGTR